MADTTQQAGKAHHSNLSSEKLLLLLEYLSQQPRPCRLHDLAAGVGLPASTALRFLRVLQNKDYVVQDADSGRYSLTLKLCGIADNIRDNYRLADRCQPFLQQVVDLFGESANLAVESDMMVTYVNVQHNPARSLLSLKHIGGVAPLHCTGVGKLLLLEYSEAQLDALLAAKGLPRYTPHTITDKEALLRELSLVRARGYAHDNEECELGVRCVAAPLYDSRGHVLAGLSASGPAVRMTRRLINERLDDFLRIAADFSRQLGWRTTI